MHESREHLPFEYAAIAFIWGWVYVVAALAVMTLFFIAREVWRGGKDPRPDSERPFYTPALREAMKRWE